MQINILESRNRLSQLVRRAQQGEEVIIANRGVPVVKMVPIRSDVVTAKGDILAWLQSHPLPASARRPHDEIERGLARERDAWD